MSHDPGVGRGHDGLRGIPVSATLTNLQSIIDLLKQKYPDARVIVAGMQMPPNMGADYTEAFQKLYPEAGAKKSRGVGPVFRLDRRRQAGVESNT